MVCAVEWAPTIVREQGIGLHIASHWLKKIVFGCFRDMAGRGVERQ